MQQIGKRIKELRISKNPKQQTVADAIGISLTAYSNIECGKTEGITLHRLEQIAAVLETKVPALLNGPSTNDLHITNLQNELQQTKEQLQQANTEIEFLRG